MKASLVIGVVVATFIVISLIMNKKKTSLHLRQLVVAIILCLIVFTISLFSGASYSDDFPLYLAVIGMTGLYLEPKISKLQIILIEVLLVLMYIIHPEKAGETSQYFLCYFMFTMGALLFYQTIKRGRAYIEMSDERAKESEKLLESIRSMGASLDRDFSISSTQIDTSTKRLQNESVSIVEGASNAVDNCNHVHDTIQETKQQLSRLNKKVREFENALIKNNENMSAVKRQLEDVGGTIEEANTTFRDMESQMRAVASIANQLNAISFNITILSLNASIEAARAGHQGAGFDVVAMRMRELSESSNDFSEQVGEIIKKLSSRVEKTSEQFIQSNIEIDRSENLMADLHNSFATLQQEFSELYENIEKQNINVDQVEYIFGNLSGKVSNMRHSCEENEKAVGDIVEAMALYKESINTVIEQTKSV